MLETLNEFKKAEWTGTRAGTSVVLACTAKSRKLRRALTSRRWEKKFCKALSRGLGYPVLSISRRKP